LARSTRAQHIHGSIALCRGPDEVAKSLQGEDGALAGVDRGDDTLAPDPLAGLPQMMGTRPQMWAHDCRHHAIDLGICQQGRSGPRYYSERNGWVDAVSRWGW
jgi:hypothetical protein